MDLISAVRSQQHVLHILPHLPADHSTGATPQKTAPPAVETIRSDAVHLPSAALAQSSVSLAYRDEDHHPAAEARAAAVAARDAYIQASIAAGLSPLPMP